MRESAAIHKEFSETRTAREDPSEIQRLQRGRRVVYYAPVVRHVAYGLLKRLTPRPKINVAIGPRSVYLISLRMFFCRREYDYG